MKKKDIILIICVFILAGGVLLWNHFVKGVAGGHALVYVDGEFFDRYDLTQEGEFLIDTEYGQNRLVIYGGKADMTEADCPDGLCVKQHSIDKTGQTIVCLPHRIVVEIEGRQADDLDGVSQ